MRLSARSGFTLIELMVSITIIMILSAIVLANLSGAGARGRDLDRQADLRALQTAIENYKRDHGRYPAMGCGITQSTNTGNADGFASESECADYITGATINGVVEPFVPNYIDRLPRDPNRGTNEGFSYVTNTNGTVYKIMAMRTVEAERVTYAHPLKSCAVNFVNLNQNAYPNTNLNFSEAALASAGWCSVVGFENPRGAGYIEGTLEDCVWENSTSPVGNRRFDSSYGLWGGFEEIVPAWNSPNHFRKTIRNTTQVICE